MSDAKNDEFSGSCAEKQNDLRGDGREDVSQWSLRKLIPYIILALLLLFLAATSFYLRHESADIASTTLSGKQSRSQSASILSILVS